MSRELLISILNGDYCRIPENLKEDIEAELAKPKPEPKGYTGCGLNLISSEEFEKLQTGLKLLYDTPLYEHPPEQRNPLSVDEIKALWEASLLDTNSFTLKFTRAIEKRHGIGGEL